MQIKNIFYSVSNTLLLVYAMCLCNATAQADEGPIRFSNNAYKQVVKTDVNGDKQFEYVEPKLVLPGDIILYEIEFENIGSQTVSDIVVNNPLPNNSIYRNGSAQGASTLIRFSVDGKHFASAEKLTKKTADGKTVPAKAKDYTAIRWIYTRPLKPGDKAKVSYKTQIKKVVATAQ